MSAELASENTGYGVVEGEPVDVLARTLTAAGYLLAGATAFFFVAFLFAFFYLRSIDKPQMWRPHGVNPSLGWGTAIIACWVVSAVLLRLGAADQSGDRRSQWRLKGLGAFVLGLAGLVLQVLAWAEQGFGPTDGAYASVYVGWTAFLALFVVGTLFWLETALATSWRYRNEPFGAAEVQPGHASGDPDRMAHDIHNPVHLNTATVATAAFYWTFLTGTAVVSWVLLYLVA
jgi:heme/copper-type cytochrome/quinol oxidase subunit 3